MFIVASNRMKTGTKTLVYMSSFELLACFIGWLGWQCYHMENMSGAVVCGIVAAVLAVSFLISGIYDH